VVLCSVGRLMISRSTSRIVVLPWFGCSYDMLCVTPRLSTCLTRFTIFPILGERVNQRSFHPTASKT
jgi:hypothetical protein